MRKVIDWYHRLLTWLMVATVAILVIPVTLQVVSRYTALKRTGRNHLGLCPFHSEKTPSFSVS